MSNRGQAAVLAALQADVAAIRRHLEAVYGPGPASAGPLLRAIAEAVGDQQFTTAQLIEHAKVHPDLSAALGWNDTTEQVGGLLGRLAGRSVEGLRLERGKRGRRGRLYRVVVLL